MKSSSSLNHNIESKNDDDEEGGDLLQILAIFLASLPALSAGTLFAWSSPSIPQIVADKENYNITQEEASYFTVIPPIGSMVGSLIFAKLNDIIGPKYTLLTVVIPYCTACILTATSTSLYILYIARFSVGLGDACIFSSLPSYVAEISTPKIRGTWGNAMTFCIYFGQLLANIIGSVLSVKVAALADLIFPVIFLCTFTFMPESPYFYLSKNRVDDARSSLQRLRRKRNVEPELYQLKSDVERQLSEKSTWKELFMVESNRKAIYAGIYLRASQQLAGIGAFIVYTQHIFLKSGGNVSASASSIIFIGLCAFLNMCAAFVLDRIGRRKSYFISLLSCGIILLAESVYFFCDEFVPSIDVQIINWFPLVGLVVYITFYSFGVGIVPTLMLGELFSSTIKSKGLCLLTLVFAVLISLTTKVFQILDSTFGLYSPFLLFSICCLVSCILALYFVPETKGKTLEQIQQSLKGNEQKLNKSVTTEA